MNDLRAGLVDATLAWERAYGNAPLVTTVLSEYDAAILVGHTDAEYADSMRGVTTVQKGFDFVFKGRRYQVKGNRPSGKPGSTVTWVPKATNYEWDFLVWILYDPRFVIQEAWQWEVEAYKKAFYEIKRLSPSHMRNGVNLLRKNGV